VRVLREALWRDTFGFVPLYTLGFALAAWFATQSLGPTWGSLARPIAPHVALWQLALAVLAGLDFLENAIHFAHARRFETGRPLAPALVWIGVPCSVVKYIAFGLGGVLFVAVLAHASWTVARDASGWRATLAVLGSYALVPVILIWLTSLALGKARSVWTNAERARASAAPASD
jgi:hypothetical protein